MADITRLKNDYPWIQVPLVVGAPMRLIALDDLAAEISKAGGIGFIGAGTDVSSLPTHLSSAKSLLQPSNLPTANATLPLGIGVINWGASLPSTLPIIQKYRPAAVWFFSPASTSSLVEWTQGARTASPATKIWIQVGSVKDAVSVLRAVHPDVLVVQGTDAGGHGLAQGASLLTLLPEVIDAVQAAVRSEDAIPMPIILAAGGITESRSAAAAFTLGASGVVLGTRFLASHEANISKGYQDAVLSTSDGGQTTVRTKVYDNLRGTTGWAETYNARGIINKSYTDSLAGMDDKENKRLYEKEMENGDAGWGVEGRMTTYAGAGVGLIREVKDAAEIVREVREGTKAVLDKFTSAAVAGKL